MSQENVEIALSGIEAWNRQDLVAFLEAWHPECEWRPAFPKGTEGSGMLFRGHAGITQAWHGVREAWEEYRLEVADAHMTGEDLVVIGHIYLRGAESGVELDSPWSAVVRFREGRIISAWDWLDHASALEAVGLSEQDAHADDGVRPVRPPRPQSSAPPETRSLAAAMCCGSSEAGPLPPSPTSGEPCIERLP